MQEKPRDLFDRVFGTISLSGDDDDVRRQRLRRSVLDSVVDQYKFFTGANSPLGAASKARVADHLDRIREFEQRAYEISRQELLRLMRSVLIRTGSADGVQEEQKQIAKLLAAADAEPLSFSRSQ